MRSPAVRLGLLLIALLLVGCSPAAPTPLTPLTPLDPTQPAETGPVGVATPGTSAAPTRRTLLVDTDAAADDLVALAFLVSSPQVELVAITVSGTGEAHCAAGVDVVLRLLDRLEAPAIAIACGRETPLAGSHTFPDAWREHVDEGSGLDLQPTARLHSSFTAIELISELSEQNRELTILTLGPLTNLADALLTDPALADRLGPVFVMGGALQVPGNLICCGAPEDNAVAEWNIYVDPHAAQVVVAGGLEPAFISLDGTSQVPVTPEFARRATETATTPAARILAELFAANRFMTEDGYFLWDPLAAQLAAGYPVGSFSPASIVVEEAEGPESGFTRPTSVPANIRYLTTVDAAAAEDTLLRVLGGG